MKRQCSTVSSSSRRENAPEKVHAKTIGCMSGILQLLSNSNSSRNRRFLTFGKKQIKNNHGYSDSPATVDSVSGVAPPQRENPKEAKITNVNAERNTRLSCEIPRSPTLPAEIRRSNPVKQSPLLESRRDPPALMARLMGLEEGPTLTPEPVAEKRERLLAALQKCDEDLKALKNIIEAVRSADPLPAPVVSRSTDKIRTLSEVKCSPHNDEQQQQQIPSPVSVLNEFTRSPLSPSSHSGRHSFGRMQQQKQQLLKKPREEEISSTYINERMTSELVHAKGKVVVEEDDDSGVMWSGKAMRKSVEEVCRDIEWGEKRELGRIGLALQDYICRDLIEEIVRELGCFRTLPFEACKRRLCF